MPAIGQDRYGQEAVGGPPVGRLLWVAVSLIGGIILGRLEVVGGIVFAGALVICLTGVGLVMIFPAWQGPRKARWIFGGLCLGFACLGGLRYELVYSYYPQDHLVHYVRNEQQLTTLRGRIMTDPYVAKPTGSLAKFDFIHQPITIFTMSCSEVKLAGGWQAASGRVLVIVDEPAGNLRAGQELQFDSWIVLRGGPSNPGQYDRRDSQHGSRTLVSARVKSSESITVLTDAPQGGFSRFRRKLADLAYTAVIEDAWFDMPAVSASYLPVTHPLVDKDSQGFLEALLLGHRHHIAGELTETFLRCGALHFLSVSGLHVGLLAGFVWWIGQVLRLRRWWRGLLALTVVVLFLFIVPPRAPILRAGIGCGIFFIAIMARRETGAINLLSLAAIVILLMRPLELFNAGFQMSFVVVLGLVLFVPVVYKWELLAPVVSSIAVKPAKLEKPPVWWKFAGSVGLRFVWGLVVVAVVAWVVGLPLTAYHFNRIAPWGMFASVLLFCPIMLTLLVGFSRLFLAAVFPALSTILAWPLYALSQISIKLAQWISALPYSSVNTGTPPIW
ncbi:MAG: ComEC/Rec2 family competence protein, partial [Planctomycetes bacterium]|nr:ComEC/Rec2 family competence protein [Planctomycetota bacterium]